MEQSAISERMAKRNEAKGMVFIFILDRFYALAMPGNSMNFLPEQICP